MLYTVYTHTHYIEYFLTLEIHCGQSKKWMVFWFPWSCAWKKLLLFLSRQQFISGSIVMDAWCLVLAGTCSWGKKEICKSFWASFRCHTGEGPQSWCRWPTPQRVWACAVFQEQGGIWPQTLLLFASPSCDRQRNTEDDKFRMRNGAWSHRLARWIINTASETTKIDHGSGERKGSGVTEWVPSFYPETYWLLSAFGNRPNTVETCGDSLIIFLYIHKEVYFWWRHSNWNILDWFTLEK